MFFLIFFFVLLLIFNLFYCPLQTPQGITTAILQPVDIVICRISSCFTRLAFAFFVFVLVTYYIPGIYHFFASLVVARVSHDDEAKLSRERRRSVMGDIQGSEYYNAPFGT